MICTIIPTLNAGEAFAPLLSTLSPHCARIVVADGGSDIDTDTDTDKDTGKDMGTDTIAMAIAGGALIAFGSKGRGPQLSRGARWAGSSDWLLFLHCDGRLPDDWHLAVQTHISKHPDKVGYFKFGAQTSSWRGRLMELIVGFRCYWWRLPYGDQGLLISRALYDQIGGYPETPLFEDVGIVDRIRAAAGRKGICALNAKIMTDVSAYDRDGWRARTTRNFRLLKAYRRGVPVETLLKEYT